MKTRVLVSGVGGDVGQGVIKALNRSSLDLEIYKICAYYNSSWLHVDRLSFMAPLVVSDEYVPFLIRFMNKYEIDVFFPCIDSETIKISRNKQKIEDSTNTVVFVDEYEKADICNDKYKTYKFLIANNFRYPNTILPSSLEDIKKLIKDVGFPLVAKRRSGHGSESIRYINTYAEARNYLGMTDYVLQEFFQSEDDEFTTGIYLGDDREVKGICTLKRELKCGSTYRAERIIDEGLEIPLIEIAAKVGVKYLNIQSRLKRGVLYPFEFNGRFSGTTGIISRIFNAPELFIREVLLKEKIKRSENRDRFVVMRYYEEVYADHDGVERLVERSKEI